MRDIKECLYKEKELNDSLIIQMLKELPEMYENGELIEVRNYCMDIVIAIDDFEQEYGMYLK